MADIDYSAILGALQQSQERVAARDPLLQAGTSMLGTQLDPTGMSVNDQIIANLTRGVVGGGLLGYGQSRAKAKAGALGDAYQIGQEFNLPLGQVAGLEDVGLLQSLMARQERENMEKFRAQEFYKANLAQSSDLLKAYVTDPNARRYMQDTGLSSLLTGQPQQAQPGLPPGDSFSYGQQRGQQVPSLTPAPGTAQPVRAPDQRVQLPSSVGRPATRADAMAGEIERQRRGGLPLKESFDVAGENFDYSKEPTKNAYEEADKLEQLGIDMEQAGMMVESSWDKAGTTGPLVGISTTFDAAKDMIVGGDDTDERARITARQRLATAAPIAIQLAKASTGTLGQINPQELELLLARGGGPTKTRQNNKLFGEFFTRQGQWNRRMASQLRQWVEQYKTVEGFRERFNQVYGNWTPLSYDVEGQDVSVKKELPPYRDLITGRPDSSAKASTSSSYSIVPPSLQNAIIEVETGPGKTMQQREAAVSRKGARGPFQFTDATAQAYRKKLGITGPYNATYKEQLPLFQAFMGDLLTTYPDERMAIAAYNAGEPAVNRAIRNAKSSKYEDIAQFLPGETRAYVMKVIGTRGQQVNEQIPTLSASLNLRGIPYAEALAAARKAGIVQ